MYESESNTSTASDREIPADVIARFAESRTMVARRSLIPWGEHCTECVWPTCYSSCDLYRPRLDGRCRRFVEGMVRIECPASLNGYLLKITFKPWAKLWSTANTHLRTLAQADKLEARDRRLATGIGMLPVAALKAEVMRKRYAWKKRQARAPSVRGELPTCLVVECYNPEPAAVGVTLTIRRESWLLAFQELLTMQPGFNRYRVEWERIAKCVDPSSRFDIELTPNLVEQSCTLFFGAIDFVLENSPVSPNPIINKASGHKTSRTCKCVVWDLDHTLWHGVLIEDGRERLRLKPRIPEILQTLDEHGVLISALSKNDPRDALAALREFGIGDFFLFPQISWNPKSIGIQQIAASLNIGLDSLLFVDDSPFERDEVQSVCPDVMVLDAAEYLNILSRPECQAPVTEESRKRRLLYRQQEGRDTAQKTFAGDYSDFLRDCHLRLTIRPFAKANMDRVHELTQRTNQMNFSGMRYSREQLLALLDDREVDTYVLDCEDRFGSYGTIGFSTVQTHEPRMTDLMFSCRIQSKRVEHAFITYILRRYRSAGGGNFIVDYRKTDRNAPAGKVFTDFGFVVEGEKEGVTRLAFPVSQPIPDDQIVDVADLTESITVGASSSTAQCA
jgi:FkbH-like protein